MCIVSLIGKQIFGRLLLEATSASPSFSSSPSSFVSSSYLVAVTRARRLSVRYTERNNTALIFEKLRSKFSARCSGFLLHNGKAEHEYYFALIVCIPVPLPWTRANTRQLFLRMNYLAYYFEFVPPVKYFCFLIHSRFYLKWRGVDVFSYVAVGEYWNLIKLILYISFNIFIVSFSSLSSFLWQVSFTRWGC